MLLPLLFLPANRGRKAWWVLLPLGLVLLIPALGMARGLEWFGEDSPFTGLILNMAIGLSMLALLSDLTAARRGVAAFFIALGILVIAALLNSLASTHSLMALVHTISGALCALAVLAGMVGARWCCRGRHAPFRFAACLLPCTALAAILAVAPFAAIGAIAHLFLSGGGGVLLMLFGMLLFGGVTGLLLAILAMPFMILAFVSPFYRERFVASLGLKPKDAAAADSLPEGDKP